MEISITLTIPDDLGAELPLGDWRQRLLESYAADQYNLRRWTAFQVGQCLSHRSRWETEQFLQAHHCYLDYDASSFELDTHLPDSFFKGSPAS